MDPHLTLWPFIPAKNIFWCIIAQGPLIVLRAAKMDLSYGFCLQLHSCLIWVFLLAQKVKAIPAQSSLITSLNFIGILDMDLSKKPI